MFFANNDLNSKAKLFVVATPLGNLEDITFRAKNVLSEVAWIACEDTRHSLKLLNHFGINKPLYAFHAHNEHEMVAKLIEKLMLGESGALISDAGTPLISDPGLPLVKVAHEKQIQVIPIPGPCALIAALSALGLPCDKFCFEGFLPVKTIARKKYLTHLMHDTKTLVFYEAPHRIVDVIADMAEIFGNQRQIGIAREITKKFEQIEVGLLGEITQKIGTNAMPAQGEFVVAVPPLKHRNVSLEMEEEEESVSPKDLGVITIGVDQILKVLLEEMALKQAVLVAKAMTGLSKNELYDRAIYLNSR